MTRRFRHGPQLLLAAMFLAGCGDQTGAGGAAAPGLTPYAGSLASPKPDGTGPPTVKTAGVAGLALECDGEPGGAEVGPTWVEPEGSPRKTLGALLTDSPFMHWWLPREGWRAERAEEDYVLFSFDVDGRSKATVVVSRGPQGWGVDAAVWCDRSEYTAATDDPAGVQVWTDKAGRRVRTTLVQSSQGPEHCGWQDVTLLNVGERQFLRAPARKFPPGEVEPFSTVASVPPTARDSGWRRNDRVLWLDDDAAYVVGPGVTERWPEPERKVGCA